MIDIGSTNFLIKVQSFPRDEFERYSTDLFDEWDRLVEGALVLPDYSISLEIEEGSIKGVGRVAAAAGILYGAIASYGSFVSGVEIIRDQVSFVNNALFERAKSPFHCSNEDVRARKSGGALSRLHGLFEKVKRGQLTPDEAMAEAIVLFGDEGEAVPGFLSSLRRELKNVPRYPEQLSFGDEEWDECEDIPTDRKDKEPKAPKPKPVPLPVSEHFKIEIWRESKKDRKHVKVTTL